MKANSIDRPEGFGRLLCISCVSPQMIMIKTPITTAKSPLSWLSPEGQNLHCAHCLIAKYASKDATDSAVFDAHSRSMPTTTLAAFGLCLMLCHAFNTSLQHTSYRMPSRALKRGTIGPDTNINLASAEWARQSTDFVGRAL